MLEIKIEPKGNEPLKLATRANELLDEICKSMLALEYLWDEVQGRYYEHSIFEKMDDAMNVGYPFQDSYEDVVRKVMMWHEDVYDALDNIFAHDFVVDEEKMQDFIVLSKEDFLKSYSYLTNAEYEATKRRVLRMAKELNNNGKETANA